MTTDNNIEAVRKLLVEDRRVTYRQIEGTLKLSAPTVHRILHDHLNVRKLCSLWVPHLMTDALREQKVIWSRDMLKKFEDGRSNYVNSIVTCDETWLYYFDVPTKSQSKVWMFEDEPPPTSVKMSRSVKKRMVAVFFTKRGILATVVLDKGKTITAAWYTEECLPQVLEALKNERPNSRLDTWLLHQDNAPAHRAGKTTDYLHQAGIKLLGHPPYSPDLAPCDFALFPYVKKQLKGRKFSSDEELTGAFEEICGCVPEGYWSNVFSTWFTRMKTCISASGDYFEKKNISQSTTKLM